MARKALVEICKEKGIRGYSGKKVVELIELIKNHEVKPAVNLTDIKTILMKTNRNTDEQRLAEEYCRDHHKNYIANRKNQLELVKKYGKAGGRLDGLCQELSETLIMLVYNNVLGDKTCRKAETGDLLSDIDGRSECKSITTRTQAPGSCGGEQHWDTLVKLDATGILEDRIKVWRLRIKDTDERWDQFKPANKNRDLKLLRPRLVWKKIEEKFKDQIDIIYEGTFEGIFTQQAME
jgi:hypothetical protein